MKGVREKTALFAEMSKKPEEERECGAKDQAGDDGEIEGGVFAAMDDVAGKFSKAEGEFAAEVKKNADKDEEGAENEERAAEFAERIHDEDSRRNEVKK